MAQAVPEVVAVIVVGPGARSTELADVVGAVAQQTRRPDVLILAHARGSNLAGDHAVVSAARDLAFVEVDAPNAVNFGQATKKGLASAGAGARWIWLLHDDCVPEPNALALLLTAGRTSKTAAVLGPKQVQHDDPSRLLELGVRVTASSRRIDDGLHDEIDQGQHDDRTEVVAVGTAGMLVRADVWDELGGLDPVLGPFGDGLEFGRRVRRAGHRVLVVPSARVAHRRASFAQSPANFRQRRFAQLYTWMAGVPLAEALFLALWLPVLTSARALIRLATGRPGLACAEVGAYLELLSKTKPLLRARRRAARVAVVPRSSYTALYEGPFAVAAMRRRKRRAGAIRPATPVLDPAVIALFSRAKVASRASFLTAVAAFFVLAALSWGRFPKGPWSLLPGSWRELWAQAFSGWQLSGPGLGGPASPVLAFFAALTAPLAAVGVQPSSVGSALLFCALPLAFGSGWLAGASVTRSVPARVGAGALWAGGAPALGGLAQGNLVALCAYLLLPLIFTGLWRGLTSPLSLRVSGAVEAVEVPRPDKVAWIALASLATAGAASAAPAVILLSLFLALALGVACHRGALTWAAAALVAAPSAVLVAPFVAATVRDQTGGWVDVFVADGARLGLSVALLAVVIAGSAMAKPAPLRATPKASRSGARTLATVGVAVLGVAVAASVLMTGEVVPASPEMPLLARQSEQGPRKARVLVLENDPELRVTLLRGEGLTLADVTGRGGVDSAAQTDLALAGASLAAGGRAQGADLAADFGVDIVLVPVGQAALVEALEATSGLERIGTVDAGTMFRVRPASRRPARAVLDTASGSIDVGSGYVSVDAAIDEGGTLALAESSSRAWRATLDGVDLQAVPGSWNQAFEVPGAGSLRVRYRPSYLYWWWSAMAASAVVLAVCAVPWRARPAERSEFTERSTMGAPNEG